MCNYSLLVQYKHACVRYCHDCETYTLVFNNLLMNFNGKGLEEFKDGLMDCYENCSMRCGDTSKRDIYFNTRLDGMQLLFSVEEVGDVLAIIQEAQFEAMQVVDSKNI